MMIRRPLSIALVDDDASVRRALGRLLASVGFEVHTFASAEAFLCSHPEQKYNCAVLDVNLRGMSGLELCTRMAAELEPVPVILITGEPDRVLAHEGARAAITCLAKPVELSLLLAALDSATAVVRTSEYRAADDKPRATAVAERSRARAEAHAVYYQTAGG
jgi:FixJ family two-component response regulator